MKHTAKYYFVITLILLLLANIQAFAQEDIPAACQSCSSYTVAPTSIASTLVKLGVVVGVVVVAMLFGWKNYHKKLYLILGSLAIVTILGTYSYSLYSRDNVEDTCLETQKENIECAVKVADGPEEPTSDAFLSPGDEFEDNAGETEEGFAAVSDDEFAAVGDEFASVGDEFSSVGDEFASSGIEAQEPAKEPINKKLLTQIIILLALCVLIGLTIQYKFVRNLRGLVLLASLVYLGFIKGACPCILMSFIDVVLYLSGNPVSWVIMTLFLGLLVVTYFFGKTWCGWVCYLGGLQEFLYRDNRFKLLTTPRSQKTIGYIRIGLLVALILQILITHTNIWAHYDPFKVVFNLISTNTISTVLFFLLLGSSLLIYRPFCRVICPVGQILSWVSMIPGTRKPKIEESCTSCKACTKACNQHAINVSAESVKISGECIACGECLDKCKRQSITYKMVS